MNIAYQLADALRTVLDHVLDVNQYLDNQHAIAAREALAAYDAQRAQGTPQLSRRELGTVLAALRYWQEVGAPPARFVVIATNGDQQNPLNSTEIDSLCERLNTR